MATKTVSDYVVERLSPIFPVATDIGVDVGSAQELLRRWWQSEGNAGQPTGQRLFDRYNLAGAVGSSLQDKAYDFWSRGLLKSGVRLPGTVGNYISTPDSVLTSITGDIDIRICLSLPDWTPAQAATDFISKWNAAANQRGWVLQINAADNGKIAWVWSQDGVGAITAKSTIATGFVDGSTGWLRVTLDVDNDAGGNDVKFYTSVDGLTWTQLGTTVTTAGVTNLFDNTQGVELGAHANGAVNPLVGTFYYAEVRRGIDGPIIAKFDSSATQVTDVQLPASINGWTWNGTALSKVDDYVRLPGIAANSVVYPDTAANSVTGDLDIRVKAALDVWAAIGADGAGTGQTLISKWDGVGNQRSYLLRMDTGGLGKINLLTSIAGTASTVSAVSTVAVPFAAGKVGYIRATIDVDNGAAGNDVTFYTSSDGVTWTQLGAVVTTGTVTSIFDSNAVLRLGSVMDGTNRLNGNIYYAEVRNGIGGPVVATFNGADNQVQTPWTINGAAWSWEGTSFQGKPGIALQLPGIAGNFVSTPDSAANSITGDIDLRAKLSLDDWTPATTNNIIAKRVSAGNQMSYRMTVDSTGKLGLGRSADGVTEINTLSTVAVSAVDGSILWIRVTRNVTTGDVNFYTSSDGIAWTQLGTMVSTGASNFFDSTSAVEIGSRDGGLGNTAGKIYYAEVRNGIDGPIVVKFDATNIAKQGVRLPAATVQPGGSPNFLTPNQASIETDASGWAVGANATLTQDATQFLDGTKSLAVTAVAVGPADMSAVTSTDYPVVPGKAYTAKASWKAGLATRTAKVGIDWRDSAHVSFGFPSSGAVADSAAAWTEMSLPGTVAPATAAYAMGRVAILAALATEVHYVDRISIVESPTPWTINGSNWDLVAA